MRPKAKVVGGQVLMQARVPAEVARSIDEAARSIGLSRAQFLERILAATAAAAEVCELNQDLFDSLVDDVLTRAQRAVEEAVERAIKSHGLLR